MYIDVLYSTVAATKHAREEDKEDTVLEEFLKETVAHVVYSEVSVV